MTLSELLVERLQTYTDPPLVFAVLAAYFGTRATGQGWIAAVSVAAYAAVAIVQRTTGSSPAQLALKRAQAKTAGTVLSTTDVQRLMQSLTLAGDAITSGDWGKALEEDHQTLIRLVALASGQVRA